MTPLMSVTTESELFIKRMITAPNIVCVITLNIAAHCGRLHAVNAVFKADTGSTNNAYGANHMSVSLRSGLFRTEATS